MSTLDQDVQELVETYDIETNEALADYNDALTQIEENLQNDMITLSQESDQEAAEETLTALN